MNTKHVPDLELCQELDRLCKEKGIVVPETEYQWQIGGKLSGETTANLVPTNRPPTYGSADSAWRFIPAPLVSEQGEWLKDYMEDKENDGEAVPDDMPKADRMGLLWEPNFMQKTLNYLLAEGIITTL